MASATRLAKAKNLPITMRHERWLRLPDHQRKWSDQALEFAGKVLSGEVGGKREHRTPYRVSGTGTCKRRRHFASEGLPKAQHFDSGLHNRFMTGDFLHLKWQMMGLTEGWLTQAEVPVDDDDDLLSGTMDGILHDGSIFEFKSINDRGFRSVVAWGANLHHIKQVHGYMYCSGKQSASIVYENKNDQDWIEIRVQLDEEIIRQITEEIDDLNDQFEDRFLSEPLTDCLAQTGSVYRQCPFKNDCLQINTWDDLDAKSKKKSRR